MPSLGVTPFEFMDQLFIGKTRVGLSVSEDFMTLACIFLTVPVCDRRMDGQLNLS